MWACRVGGAGLQVAVWCPSRRHPHLHRPLSLAPGHGPAAGWFPRLHPRGAHQQRAPGLQGPPPQALGVSPGCKSCSVCRHGLCRAVEKDSVVCECHPGWTGPLCDQEARDPCLGHRSVFRALPAPPSPPPQQEVSTDGSWKDCSQTAGRTCGGAAQKVRHLHKEQVLLRRDVSVQGPG